MISHGPHTNATTCLDDLVLVLTALTLVIAMFLLASRHVMSWSEVP